MVGGRGYVFASIQKLLHYAELKKEATYVGFELGQFGFINKALTCFAFSWVN